MKKKEILLNSVFLKNRVTELGLKQWWLAEQVGVDRKTVARWLQGKIKSVQNENAKALCEILDCELSDLSLANEADQLATFDDQKQAAQLLAQSSLIEKLGPIGEWDVIESLLKATIVPGLPLNVLGELYNQLTVACWRQSKINQANVYNEKAIEIARRCQDKTILAHALLSQANISAWRGKTLQAVKTYKEVLLLEKFVSQKTLGATYSNFGGVLYENGDLEQGEACQRKALELFHFDGTSTNHSISHTHLTIIYLKQGRLAEAQAECSKVLDFAKTDDYRRGIFEGLLLQAEIDAHQGNREAALNLMRSSLDGFAKMGIEEGLNYEIAGRICRLVHQLSESQAYLEKGIEISDEFPVYQAALYFELARTLHELGSETKEAAGKAIEIYRECEAPLQVANVQNWLNSVT